MSNAVKIQKVLSSNYNKVIMVSGNSGDILEKHKVDQSATLLVKKGSVEYKETGESPQILSEGEGYTIPKEIFHQVTCISDAEIFLVVPIEAKMKFQVAS